MKQVLFERYGSPARVVQCATVADPPAPNPWEVSVDIRAAAVNPSDLSVLRGQYGMLPPRLPATAGLEASGVITAVGDQVSDVSVGDRVILIANNNWCQRRTIRSNMVFKTPDELDDLQAAMVKTNSLCAYLMLRDIVDLQPGDYIIQTAPLGVVGRMIIGMARARGLHTVNIARSAETAEAVRALGGDVVVIDGEDMPRKVQEATGRAPILLGLDAVAGDVTARLADCLADGAALINYGMLSAESCQIRPDQTIFRDIRLRGFWLAKILNRMTQVQRVEAFAGCLDLMVGQGLRNQIDRTYSLDQIAEAIERAESAERRGKVMLLPNGDLDG